MRVFSYRDNATALAVCCITGLSRRLSPRSHPLLGGAFTYRDCSLAGRFTGAGLFAGAGPGELLPPARAGVRREPASDAGDRRDVSGAPGLRFPADDPLAAPTGLSGESQAGAPADAADGVGGDLSEAEPLPEELIGSGQALGLGVKPT